jgi:hypothetical protein
MSKATDDLPDTVYVGSDGESANTWHVDPECDVLEQALEINQLDGVPRLAGPCAFCTDHGVTASDLEDIGETHD